MASRLGRSRRSVLSVGRRYATPNPSHELVLCKDGGEHLGRIVEHVIVLLTWWVPLGSVRNKNTIGIHVLYLFLKNACPFPMSMQSLVICSPRVEQEKAYLGCRRHVAHKVVICVRRVRPGIRGAHSSEICLGRVKLWSLLGGNELGYHRLALLAWVALQYHRSARPCLPQAPR